MEVFFIRHGESKNNVIAEECVGTFFFLKKQTNLIFFDRSKKDFLICCLNLLGFF